MKIGLVSLGCPKNLVDSEVMLGLARDAGHELTQNAAEADVLVVNTCAFIDSAKQESVDTILEMARLKQNGACRKLIVTGCLAERYRDDLRREIPEIDAVLGTGEVPAIVNAIDTPQPRSTPLAFFRSAPGAPAGRPAVEESSSLVPPGYIYDVETPRVLATPRHYAYVKVGEGCDYSCAFCIIPALRGGYRSRTSEAIVNEARSLAARGVKELILISQDTTFYAIDRGERGALARLLRTLNTVEGLEWIRLLYLYPTTVDDATLDAMAECEKVVKYVDLPLQHASDPVLKRMRRPGTRRKYEELLDRIRTRVPGVAIRTTFIVGFPGETGDDVDVLHEFVERQRFDNLGVFTYSHEEGTPAYGLTDDVPAAVKKSRRNRLMSLQKGVVKRQQKTRLGRREQVLIDGPSGDHDLVLRGRLASQAPDIDGAVYLTDCDPSGFRAGDLVDVEIVGAREYDLLVRPIATALTVL